MEARADNFPAGTHLWDINLSRNISLRTLEVTARSFDGALWTHPPDAAARLLKYALSTITSLVFSEVVVFYRDRDFHGIKNLPTTDGIILYGMSPDEVVEEALWHRRRFEILRIMHKVRDFRLVLCVNVWEHLGRHAVQILKEAVAAEKASRGFDDFFSEPEVVYSPRASRPEETEHIMGGHPYYWTSL